MENSVLRYNESMEKYSEKTHKKKWKCNAY